MKVITTHSPSETQAIGEQLAKLCKGGEIICLSGDLGTGKTTFVKGIARGLKIDEKKVNSPTFVIMNLYEEGRLPLYHFDFYRLEKPEEIGGVGYDEFLYGNGVAVIEWSERFGALMPPENLAIHLAHSGDHDRGLKITAHGERYKKIAEVLCRP
ncbi:MAG: tRNA (adenosine(37)-N6)-threonylcarbamoyltransferase complex ATPase subunit type 1 TsaE [Candidatus Omnitrophica bacterium]|nr:tRNA (adenosine(37)-N6)-threonylcarbamoyltransferase complex ATPase subunit type 1 TsaE [Candidatus Omnitrophota bacterium]